LAIVIASLKTELDAPLAIPVNARRRAGTVSQ
jgi:hypothetical protein